MSGIGGAQAFIVRHRVMSGPAVLIDRQMCIDIASIRGPGVRFVIRCRRGIVRIEGVCIGSIRLTLAGIPPTDPILDIPSTGLQEQGSRAAISVSGMAFEPF